MDALFSGAAMNQVLDIPKAKSPADLAIDDFANRAAAIAEIARKAAEKAEAERLERLRPDVEKVRGFADEITKLVVPDVDSPEAITILNRADEDLCRIADRLAAWSPEKKEQP
jgi:hypothetical protein